MRSRKVPKFVMRFGPAQVTGEQKRLIQDISEHNPRPTLSELVNELQKRGIKIVERRYPPGIEKFRRWLGPPGEWGPKEWELVAHRSNDKSTAAKWRQSYRRYLATERKRAAARRPRPSALAKVVARIVSGDPRITPLRLAKQLRQQQGGAVIVEVKLPDRRGDREGLVVWRNTRGVKKKTKISNLKNVLGPLRRTSKTSA